MQSAAVAVARRASAAHLRQGPRGAAPAVQLHRGAPRPGRPRQSPGGGAAPACFGRPARSQFPVRCSIFTQLRLCSDRSGPRGDSQQEDSLRSQVADGSVPGTREQDAYALAFTCGVCENRSAKKISKQAYHHGVVIVQCEHCENRHLIADHLKWFSDERIDIETIMREKGEEVKRLNQFRLGDSGAPQTGPAVQVEGLNIGTAHSAESGEVRGQQSSAAPPVVVPDLEDVDTVVAAAEAAGAEAAAMARDRQQRAGDGSK